jgi:DUF1365 family protein
VPFWCAVVHERHEAVRHRFGNRMLTWLVDLDGPCRFGWPLRLVAGFDPGDHLGDPARGIRANIDRFLALNGVARPARVLMLAQARQFGYVFDPVSAFFCYDTRGALRHAVLEVRNTFGDRHCYLVALDASGRAEAAKQLYVSPMFATDGRYLIRLRLHGRRADIGRAGGGRVPAERLGIDRDDIRRAEHDRPGIDGVEIDRLDIDSVRMDIVLRRDQVGHRRGGREHTALLATLRGRRLPVPVGCALLVLSPRLSRGTTRAIHAESRRLQETGVGVRRRRRHLPQPGVDSCRDESIGEESVKECGFLR